MNLTTILIIAVVVVLLGCAIWAGYYFCNKNLQKNSVILKRSFPFPLIKGQIITINVGNMRTADGKCQAKVIKKLSNGEYLLKRIK